MMQNDLRNSYDLSSLLWIVAVLLAVLFSAPAIAGGNSVDSPQQSAIPDKITIKGTVVDKNSLPVAGATVVAKDRPALGGTVTDHKGHFTFAAPLGTILQISFVGYAPEEKAIDAQTEWIITLQEDNNVIDDIVVVGYGVQKKESVIGAISQVKGDELVDSGTTNLKNALAGKVSGMSVISSSGAPGEIDSQTSILLRGLSSWKGNNSARQAIAWLRNRPTNDDEPGLGTFGDPYLDECAAEATTFEGLVKNEWRVETCFEGDRYYNLRRWATDVSEINKPIHMAKISNQSGLISYEYPVVETLKYPSLWAPIPYTEIRKCPKLLQNQGWETWK